MEIRTKRVYDQESKSDGYRILVDRLWARGVKKEDAHIDLWAKDLAPSNELRKWLHEDTEKRSAEFKERYKEELKVKEARLGEILPKKGPVTLVTSVKDVDHSHIPVLRDFLTNQ